MLTVMVSLFCIVRVLLEVISLPPVCLLGTVFIHLMSKLYTQYGIKIIKREKEKYKNTQWYKYKIQSTTQRHDCL